MEEERKQLEQIAQGDRKAFDNLFRMYYKYLVTIAYGYTKDSGQSKDLVQEVFMDLWRRREQITITTSVRAFLKRAIINQSLTLIKKRKVQTSLPEEELQVSSDDNAHRAIEFNELNKKIQSIIEQMPERCKAVFLLSRFEGLSHKEIAQKLDISTKTIENQITKALKLMRKGLKEDYFIAITMILTSSI